MTPKRGWVWALVLSSPRALAQSPGAGVDAAADAAVEAGADMLRVEARAHFDQGVELAARGEFEQALAQFEAAHRSSPNFAVLYNIGQAHIELGHPLLAIAALEHYLRQGALEISTERAEATRAQIAQQKAHVAELTLIIEPPGASIELDGQSVGQAPLLAPLLVDPGVHWLSVRAEGNPPVTRQVTLARGERHRLELTAVIAPKVAATDPLGASMPLNQPDPFKAGSTAGADDGAQSESRSSRLDWLGYALGGLGVAAGGVALGHYFYNRERYQDWQAEDAQLSSEPPPDDYRERQHANNQLASSIDDASRVTVALAVASGVLVAGGVTVLVVDATREPAGKHSARGSEQLSLCLGGTW